MHIGAYAVLVCIMLYGLFSYLNSYTLHGEELAVPNIRGYHISEVEHLLANESLGFVVVDSIYVEKVGGGMVMEQIPDSGFLVKMDRKIYLTLSAYQAPKIPLPNLKFDDRRNVIAQLRAIGFKVDSISYIPSECVDCLEFIEIRGKRIPPGTKLDIGTSLALVLGGGKSDQFVPIPYLGGMSMADALETTKQAGLKISVMVLDAEFTASDSLNAFVYKQIPAPTNNPSAYLGSPIQLFFTTDDNKRPEIPIVDEPQDTLQ